MADTKWFEEARYGLFIHFGLYAIPGGIWNGVKAPHGTEWIMRNLQIPLKDYRKLADTFNPTAFNAKDIVGKAREFGMKYLVFTAKHHDGYALYDTKVSDYSVMHSPIKRDLVKELADACREAGLVFCLYYSQMQDWEDENGNGNTWDFDPQKQDFSKYFYGKVIPQVKELLTNYGKIGLIWFDTPYDMPEELCKELERTVHTLQKECLINGRIGYRLGDYRQTADNSIPSPPLFFPWESPMTLNHTWGYSQTDDDFKSPSLVISQLVNIAGKGGNLLLNVGPGPDGTIPEKSVSVLKTVGEWLKKNGESIYGTTAAPDMPYLLPWGNITAKDGGKTLYFHVQNYPLFPYRILLTGLENEIEDVTLLDGTKLKYSKSYEIARDEHRFYVFLPETPPDKEDTVVKVRLKTPCSMQTL
ncbi:MAG: alpha-L-fucosidase [Clostridia bacterium]|nr:alpha-L-fucosidase [Clostridia bacterium]